jgi:hypothetical protein
MAMMFNVEVKGLDKVHSGSIDLAKAIPTVGLEVEKILAREVRKSAKLRVKRWSTTLAGSIDFDLVDGHYKVSSDSDYGAFQELGFRKHRLSAKTPTRSGFSFGEWMTDRNIIDPRTHKTPTGLWVGGSVSSYHRFMFPALYAVMGRADKIILREIVKEIKKSFRVVT